MGNASILEGKVRAIGDAAESRIHTILRVTVWTGIVAVLALLSIFLQVEAPAFRTTSFFAASAGAERGPASEIHVPTVAAPLESSVRTLTHIEELPALRTPPASGDLVETQAEPPRAPPVPATGFQLLVLSPSAGATGGERLAAFDGSPPSPVASTAAAPRVQRIAAPLILIARVTGPGGEPAAHQPVHWSIDPRGVGRIVSVDADFERRPTVADEPRTGDYARGTTCDRPYPLPVAITSLDETIIEPGSAWCMVDSLLPGDMVLTAVVPGIAAATDRQAVLRVHWDAAEAQFPHSMEAPVASQLTVATRVVDPQTRQPRSGYTVRYVFEELGGIIEPAAGKFIESVSDVDGIASARLVHDGVKADKTRIRAMLLGGGPQLHTAPIQLASNPFEIRWIAPDARLKAETEPIAGLGEWTTVAVGVSNADFPWPHDVRLFARVPDELDVAGGSNHGEIDLGAPHRKPPYRTEVTIRARQTGKYKLTFELRDARRLWAATDLSVEFVRPALAVRAQAPPQWWAGESRELRTTIENVGPVAAHGVRFSCDRPVDLHVERTDGLLRDRELVWEVGSLKPREKRVVVWTVQPQRAYDNFALKAACTAENFPPVELWIPVTVRAAAALALSISDEAEPILANGVITYDVVLENRGTAAAESIPFEAGLSDGVRALDAGGTIPARISGGSVTLGPLPRLEPGTKASCRLRVRPTKVGEARITVRVTHPSIGPRGLVAQESTTVYSSANGDERSP
jgi:hypothetical protein